MGQGMAHPGPGGQGVAHPHSAVPPGTPPQEGRMCSRGLPERSAGSHWSSTPSLVPSAGCLPAPSAGIGRRLGEAGTSHFRPSGGCLPRAHPAHFRLLAWPSCPASCPSQTQKPTQDYLFQEALSDWALVPFSFSSDFPVWSHTLEGRARPLHFLPPCPSSINASGLRLLSTACLSLDFEGQGQEHSSLTKQTTHRFLHRE